MTKNKLVEIIQNAIEKEIKNNKILTEGYKDRVKDFFDYSTKIKSIEKGIRDEENFSDNLFDNESFAEIVTIYYKDHFIDNSGTYIHDDEINTIDTILKKEKKKLKNKEKKISKKSLKT